MSLNISEEHYKKLQQILENEGHHFTFEEVQEIGDDLIEFYQLLLADSDTGLSTT